MRREVELLFDSIVREDRSIVDLLTADYTFVNERLAKHYGIPNIYGSQFRRVTLGPDMDVRRGLLGKGAFLTTTAKPERTSPVTRGKWIMTNILGMSPPDPPPNVPPLPPQRGRRDRQREAAVDAREDADAPRAGRLRPVPQHDGPDRVRARELRRDRAVAHRGRGHAGRSDRRGVRRHEGRRPGCAAQLAGRTATRTASSRSRPRSCSPTRWAAASNTRTCRWCAPSPEAGQSNNRFSALVLAVVKSDPFRMNMKVDETSAPKQAAVTPSQTYSKISSSRHHEESTRCLLQSDTFRAGRSSKAPALRWRFRCWKRWFRPARCWRRRRRRQPRAASSGSSSRTAWGRAIGCRRPRAR